MVIRNHVNTYLPKITHIPLCVHSIYNLIHAFIGVPVTIISQKKRPEILKVISVRAGRNCRQE